MAVEMTSTPLTHVEAQPASPASRRWLARAGQVAMWLLAAVATIVVAGLLVVSVGPRLLPYQALVVRSGSMAPAIPTGSVVFYRKRPASRVRVGDVIVFTKPGRSSERVTHRVYRIGTSTDGRYFVTKGDANATPDDWRVPAVGSGWIATFHLPYVGYVLDAIDSGAGRLLLLLVPAMLLGAITLYEIWRDRAGGAEA